MLIMRFYKSLIPLLRKAKAGVSFVDFLIILFISFINFSPLPLQDQKLSNGLWFTAFTGLSVFYHLILCIVFLLRRTWPEFSALASISIVLQHLLTGPSLLSADCFIFPIICNVISRGNKTRRALWITISYIMAIWSSLIIAWNVHVGSIIKYYSEVEYCSPFDLQCLQNIVSFQCMLVALSVIATTLSIIFGLWQHAHLQSVRILQERNQALAASQLQEQIIAASAERARIARDMHDVVAHTLSIIIAQSDGGQYAATKDIALARSTMLTIQQEAKHASNDMRRVLEKLTDDTNTPCNWEHIPSLIEQARLASAENTIDYQVHNHSHVELLDNERQEIAYRVIQESLSNIRKHAGKGSHVLIEEYWQQDYVRLVVNNTVTHIEHSQAANSSHTTTNSQIRQSLLHTPLEQEGYGLIGMRERLEHVGGHISAGLNEHNHFVLNVCLPYSRVEHPEDEQLNTNPYNFMQHVRRIISSQNARMKHTLHKLIHRGTYAGSDTQKPTSWIEQLYVLTHRHWLITDIVSIAPLIAIVIFWGLSPLSILPTLITLNSKLCEQTLYNSFTLITLVCLMTRRRIPETSALIVGIISIIQLLVLPNLLTVNIGVFILLYSASLYGRKEAWQWVILLAMINIAIITLKTGVAQNTSSNSNSLLILASMPLHTLLITILSGLSVTMFLALACCATVAFGYYRRNDNNNVLLLQTRNHALEQEKEHMKILAANTERARVSVQLQQEVNTTLQHVIHVAHESLAMLTTFSQQQDCLTQSESEQIRQAFKHMSTEGRQALQHIRQLLGILRETGNVTQVNHLNELKLKPAATLDEQLQNLS